MKNNSLTKLLAFSGLTFWFGSFMAQGEVVQVGTMVDPDNVIINNITPPLFQEVGSIPIVGGRTYVRDVDIFTGTSGVPTNPDGTPVDPSVTFELLTTTVDDGVNNNSITAMDDWNLVTVAGRRSFSDDPDDQGGRPAWQTGNFGGKDTFISTNDDGPDFILFENNANDDLVVQAVFPDGTTGQWTGLIVGDDQQVALWGDTSLVSPATSIGAGQGKFGVGWRVEDLLGADGNPLPQDTEIFALRFNDPAQSPDTGLDPLLLVAVIQSQGLSQVGTMVDPDNVIINNITPPLFQEVGSIPIVGGRTYVRDVDIFTGTSGVPTNPDGTPVDPSVTFELLTTTVDDGVNNNSITAMDDWNLVTVAGRRSFSDDPDDQGGRPAWQTGNFGGKDTFISTNKTGPDFILIENNANDDLVVQAVFPDGTTGQWTGLIVGDDQQVALWGDTSLVSPATSIGAGQGKFGVGWRVEDLLGADGNPLLQDTEIFALRFNGPAQSPDTGLDPCLLVAVIIDTTPRAVGEVVGSNTITLAAEPTADITVGKLVQLEDGTTVGKIASIAGRVLTLEAALEVAIATNAPLFFVEDLFIIETAGNVVNISTRGLVGAGDEAMIGGFIVFDGNQTVVVFAKASELAAAGVPNLLADPVLTIENQATGEVIMVNDNWEDDPDQAQLIADLWGGTAPLTPGSTSSAAVLTVPLGNWTVRVNASDGTASGGIAQIEVYEVQPN